MNKKRNSSISKIEALFQILYLYLLPNFLYINIQIPKKFDKLFSKEKIRLGDKKKRISK